MMSAHCFMPRRLAETSRGTKKLGSVQRRELASCSHQRAATLSAESSARDKLNIIYDVINNITPPGVYKALQRL